jgi:hypothetical protein
MNSHFIPAIQILDATQIIPKSTHPHPATTLDPQWQYNHPHSSLHSQRIRRNRGRQLVYIRMRLVLPLVLVAWRCRREVVDGEGAWCGEGGGAVCESMTGKEVWLVPRSKKIVAWPAKEFAQVRPATPSESEIFPTSILPALRCDRS